MDKASHIPRALHLWSFSWDLDEIHRRRCDLAVLQNLVIDIFSSEGTGCGMGNTWGLTNGTVSAQVLQGIPFLALLGVSCG